MMQKNEFRTVRGYQLLKLERKQLTSAMEDYLEMISRNIDKEGYMRINMLSELLNVKPSSATKMVQKLTELGYLDYKKYGIIFLTKKGKEMGKYLLKRHNIVERFLACIGIEENLLAETELIEHNVSANTLKSMEQLCKFFESHPEVLRQFEKFKREEGLDNTDFKLE